MKHKLGGLVLTQKKGAEGVWYTFTKEGEGRMNRP